MGVKTVCLVVGAVFLLTVVKSKPVSLNTAADESDSVEVDSSEEAVNEEVEEMEEPELPEAMATESTITEAPITEAANVMEPSEPPATIALPAATDATAPSPDAMDPQTSTDGLQMLPEDPSQTPLGVDVSQDSPSADPGVEVATDLPPHANDVQQEALPAATPYPPYVKGKASRMAVVEAVPVRVNPGVPVCFTFQYAAPQYSPPRGDSY